MSKLAYFNPADGRILQWIDTDAMAYNLPDASMLHACSDEEWELQHQGEMMVKAGDVVPYIAPIPNLAQLKAAKWEAIKAERDRRTDQGGYKVGGQWFHSDQKSRSQQQDNEAMGSALESVNWKTMDGSFVVLTAQLAAAIRQARMTSDRAIFAAAEAHRAALEDCEDPAVYDFSGGWPAMYGE